ncbi:hypothetical protein ACFVKB_42735 [Rhodococcus sp. NPDC127530]|uniref:hypothetical protein n=1 Tax=unclassified Rhodococcus (in: high G+C Gram-positive bacteria) TaxID=192944 RepID=UPI0036367D49
MRSPADAILAIGNALKKMVAPALYEIDGAIKRVEDNDMVPDRWTRDYAALGSLMDRL